MQNILFQIRKVADFICDPGQLISLLHFGIIDELRITRFGHAALLQFELSLRRRSRQSPVGIVIRIVVGLDRRPSVVHDGIQQNSVMIRK